VNLLSLHPFELTDEQVRQARVVVVDDDELVTRSLSSFLSLEMNIGATVFNESTRAAAYLSENEADLIISDFLMPEMDGIQLLAKVRDRQPEVPRILLTGYADKENAIKAINDARVFQYLEKPWENEQLKRVVINGLERVSLLRLLSSKVEELATTKGDLSRLRRALMRAFA